MTFKNINMCIFDHVIKLKLKVLTFNLNIKFYNIMRVKNIPD